VEEREYKSTYSEIASIRCEFEKSLTNNKARCACARHFWLADREGYACKSEQASARCRSLLEKLREKSRFILKLPQADQKLPHNMEIRVQAGGLNGIEQLFRSEHKDRIEDIYALIEQAEAEYSSLGNLPFDRIVQSISRYQGRRSRKRNFERPT
jgi:hypothetical protein